MVFKLYFDKLAYMKIGVDLDDILSPTKQTLINLHNKRFKKGLRISKINKEELKKIWEKNPDFSNTSQYKKMEPMKGSVRAMKKLKKNNELYVITARPKKLKKNTEKWISKYFPNIFSGIYFIKKETKNSPPLHKHMICNNLDIDILIEDKLSTAIKCTTSKRKVLLFDYPWNQTDKLPKNIIRIKTWKEIKIK